MKSKEHFRGWMLENIGIQDANNYAGTQVEDIAVQYAKYDAMAFANWLQYQEIDGRSTEKLYKDFKEATL